MSNNSLHASGMDDQLSFNRLAFSERQPDGGLVSKRFPLKRARGDGRVMMVGPDDTTRLMVLPSAVFAGKGTLLA
jgi:hypothetical protein